MRETAKNNSTSKKQISGHKFVDNDLCGHDTAIHEYLESLLLEVDETDESQGAAFHEAPAPAACVLGLEQLVAEIPSTIVETRSEPQTQQEIQGAGRISVFIV